VPIHRVGRCKSASAVDIQYCNRWHLRNCCRECASVTSCSVNAASEWSHKLASRLMSANDADEVACGRQQLNTDASCCMASRQMSSHVSAFHTECHCVACCSCSPFDRHSGNCPTFTFPVRTVSVRRVRSLESGLALCRSCSRRLSATKDLSGANLLDSVHNTAGSDAVFHKSSSVPACCSSQLRHYTAGISFDSLNADTCRSQHFAVNSTSLDCSQVSNDGESASTVSQSEMSSQPAGLLSVDCVYRNDQVSPVEYHKRFEVCSL